MIRNQLVIMVKAPRMGLVKTRLSRGIGASEALRFYRTATGNLIRRLGRDGRWQTHLAIAPDRDLQSPVWPDHVRRMSQGQGDLGARMQHVFDSLPAGPVVIVGSDIPGISADHIDTAFRALGQSDVVIGPALDGGYWLIGQKRRPTVLSLFDGVRWSSETTLDDTLANARQASVARLEPLPDVDEAEDYKAWRAQKPGYLCRF
ncbi:TIGR04282 family arsenosugar biosynthesis glycosyltransferase [Coralliovum pocilloporae]|uniref:TIGR04282 family arsenosugar biosynthesis glycosyltransferase n=1 Tax=Coralliovum pocilloporae TaxID=3066369 RepID=UPI003307176D